MGGRRSFVVGLVGVCAVVAGGVTVAGAKVPAPLVVSVGQNGHSANGDSAAPAVSRDGHFVAFVSSADDIVPGDGNAAADVFVRDLMTDVTTLVSVARSGGTGNGASDEPSISANGRFVAFRSAARDLVAHDTNKVDDVFVRDLVMGKTTRVSVASDGTQANFESEDPYISGDGHIVAFTSLASNIAVTTLNAEDAFTHDLRTGATVAVAGESGCGESSIAEDVAGFSADATHVAILEDCRGTDYLYDRVIATGAKQMVDEIGTGVGAGGSLSFARYTPNASKLAWLFDERWDDEIHLLDLRTQVLHRIRPRSTGLYGYGLGLSADGRRVLYIGGNGRANIGYTFGQPKVYSYDLRTHEFHYVSVPLGGPSTEANGPCSDAALSADGRVAAFSCDASDLVRGDRNDASDVFVRTVVSAPPPSL
jgi:Tol biopolymer transport system component